ncbi:MAG: acetyl-CoA hydrolase [Deltaproteobacteria bacterium]|nr:MAG: acetyl-CoA hydrolase [Deltaproteobacteria bacterium]
MSKSIYWADNYVAKKQDADQAIESIRSGQLVFIGSACGEPQVLVRALAARARYFSGLEIIRMMSRETASLTEIANQTHDMSLNLRQIYLGGSSDDSISRNKRFITPMNVSEVPGLFINRRVPINVALIQVAPVDDFGWMSLGISVDVTLAAASSADLVIAQVNPRMPRILGQSFIHVNDVDIIVEYEEELLTLSPKPPSSVATMIGKNISRLIQDGSTLQVGLDSASQATLQALRDKNDLGFHSLYLTDDIMHLYARGVINNCKKGINEGKLVASAALGSAMLYEFLNNNPGVDFRPSDYVNDPFVIAQHHRMVSMNVAKAIDLTGQVTIEAASQTNYAGVSGVADFVRGAKRSAGGKSILMLNSTTPDGKKSNIIPQLTHETVVVPRGDVQYVATEYGVVNLLGKSLQGRAMAMISIAHPDFRDELFQAAKEDGLVGSDKSLGGSGRGVYPVRYEERLEIDGQVITIRPAKPVDDRRIQEHYYRLKKEDVLRRFFHEKTIFGRTEVEGKSQADYIKDFALVGVVGEFGFDKVIAVGEYLLLTDSNMAEVAFSVSSEFQGKGLGKLFLRKLAQAAKENGIAGLVAYTSPQNKAMVQLFKTLPCNVTTSFDGDALSLKCLFDTSGEAD